MEFREIIELAKKRKPPAGKLIEADYIEDIHSERRYSSDHITHEEIIGNNDLEAVDTSEHFTRN